MSRGAQLCAPTDNGCVAYLAPSQSAGADAMPTLRNNKLLGLLFSSGREWCKMSTRFLWWCFQALA
ncbi:hypothetical protein [Anabaena azotica]|uniref:Uncharacterized protein n=1 Tax=Anabaena azotica FACHB-119 TaxID=947527 RepID=A0ABR8CYR5_9NOST|nr:hypothetical protein [Anabaena azotica]MBD2500079.1 hypothetical protein [Anabaena azotica FACHB-119]